MDHLSIVPDMHSIPELTPTANFFWSQILSSYLYKVSQRPKFSQSRYHKSKGIDFMAKMTQKGQKGTNQSL